MGTWETDEFKRLQNEWYQRLSDSGFEEIENTKNGALKEWSVTRINRMCKRQATGTLYLVSRETRQYYRSAQWLLDLYSFESIRDKKIWELHCEGLSTRQIASQIGTVGYCTVSLRIKKLREIFLKVETIQSVKMVSIRDFHSEDNNFIYATWLHSIHANNNNPNLNRAKSMMNMHKRITEILAQPDTVIKVACLDDAADVILGYAIYQDKKLWWVYIKKAWREMGIAKKLIPQDITSCAFLTKIGKIVKPKTWDVDPGEELE